MDSRRISCHIVKEENEFLERKRQYTGWGGRRDPSLGFIYGLKLNNLQLSTNPIPSIHN